MAKYGIDKAMAEARAHVTPKPVNKVFTIDQPYSQVKGHLLHAVARALHCKGVTLRTSGPTSRVHVFGFESDVELVEMLYTSLLLQMAHATARHPISSLAARPGGHGRAAQLHARLRRRRQPAPGGRLRARSRQPPTTPAPRAPSWCCATATWPSRARWPTAYPKLTKTRITWRGGGYGAGHEAGQRANIHDRPNVGAGTGRELSR